MGIYSRFGTQMRTFLAAFVFLACSLAAEEWTFVKSPNFELYTTAGSGEARRTIEYFEQVRDFFDRTSSIGQEPSQVGLASERRGT